MQVCTVHTWHSQGKTFRNPARFTLLSSLMPRKSSFNHSKSIAKWERVEVVIFTIRSNKSVEAEDSINSLE